MTNLNSPSCTSFTRPIALKPLLNIPERGRQQGKQAEATGDPEHSDRARVQLPRYVERRDRGWCQREDRSRNHDPHARVEHRVLHIKRAAVSKSSAPCAMAMKR
jgi:hypothetical protein